KPHRCRRDRLPRRPARARCRARRRPDHSGLHRAAGRDRSQPLRLRRSRPALARKRKLRNPMTTTSLPSRRLFTSESVTEGHPDKLCDAISDAVLDALLAFDPAARVAVETMVTTGQVHVAGEVGTAATVDITAIVRAKLLEIGYDSS